MTEDKFTQYEAFAAREWPSDLGLWKNLLLGFIANMRLNIAAGAPETPMGEYMLDMFARIARARLEGKPLIMHPFNYGPELFYAMDLEPLMQEVFSVGLAPFHLNEPYIDLANQMGYGDNPTLCNAQRPLIATHLNGDAPKVDLLFYLSAPCNSLATTYQVYEHMTGIPTFTMDIPYWSHDPASPYYEEKTLDYMKAQYKDMIFWLEKQTHRSFNPDRFQETMARVNQCRGYIMEFNDLLKTVPCPVNSMESFSNYLTMVLAGGTEDSVRMTKWFRDYAAENVRNKKAGVPGEKLRIAWPYTHTFFDRDLFPWIEEKFKAVVIMDILGFYNIPPHDISTLEKCFDSLALGTLDFSMIHTCRGPAEFYIDYLLRFVEDYRIDCVIIPMQFACKHAYAITKIAAEAVRREADIPVLIFGCDPYDSREVPAEEIRGKIEEFITEIVL